MLNKKAFNIKWDTDGDKELLKSLPSEIEIPDDLEDEEEISDYISDVTGYCHFGFELNFEDGREIKKELSIKEIERRLNDGLNRTKEEREHCIKWLYEYYTANELTLNELDDLCFSDSNWIFEQIFE